MTANRAIHSICVWIVFAMLIACPAVFFAQGQGAAQKSDGKLKDISRNLRIKRVVWRGASALTKPPEYEFRVVARTTSRPIQDWGVITVAYDTFPKWIDQLVVKYYILLHKSDRAKDEKGGDKNVSPVTPYTMLQGMVTYVDVKEGNNHISTMYIRPSAIDRYGEPVAVGIEINYEDEVVGISEFAASVQLTKDAISSGRWWGYIKDSENVSIKTDILLNRQQSPFILANYTDEESIRP